MPASASTFQRAGSRPLDAGSHAVRTAVAGQIRASMARVASRNASCSSVNAKRNAPYFRGRPRRRSATMLRWISFVPA